MNRRTFGLLVRLLAVLAAIYAFFSLRSQLAHREPPRGTIPVKVVNQKVCGSLTVEKSSSTTSQPVSLDENPTLRQAIEKPGESVEVRSDDECERLSKLNGSVFSTDQDSFVIQFNKAL